jgi:hypothetical protein
MKEVAGCLLVETSSSGPQVAKQLPVITLQPKPTKANQSQPKQLVPDITCMRFLGVSSELDKHL